jgi:hypothetical protein
MSELLDLALQAHDALERWPEVRKPTVQLTETEV